MALDLTPSGGDRLSRFRSCRCSLHGDYASAIALFEHYHAVPLSEGVAQNVIWLAEFRKRAFNAEEHMQDAVYAVTEIVGSSQDALEDAIRSAVRTGANTLPNLEWFEVTIGIRKIARWL